jgi:hypothetical protein
MIIDMAGHVNTSLSDDERRLFDTFMAEWKAAGRSPEKAPVDGISPRQLRRYAKGYVPVRMEDDTKIAMSRYLAGRGKGEGLSTALVQVPAMDVIHLPEWLQEVIRDDAKAAVLRAEALRDFGRAARLEAEQARAREGLTSGSSDWKVLGAQGEVAVASVEFQEGTRPEQTTPPPPPSSRVDGKERSDE